MARSKAIDELRAIAQPVYYHRDLYGNQFSERSVSLTDAERIIGKAREEGYRAGIQAGRRAMASKAIDWADLKAARLCDGLSLNDDPAVEPCFSIAAALRAERERDEMTKYRYSSMCRMDHEEIGYNAKDDGPCPVCAERERALEEAAELVIAVEGTNRGLIGKLATAIRALAQKGDK